VCESEQPQSTIAVTVTNTTEVMPRLPTPESVRRSAHQESGRPSSSDIPGHWPRRLTPTPLAHTEAYAVGLRGRKTGRRSLDAATATAVLAIPTTVSPAAMNCQPSPVPCPHQPRLRPM
jgi:hypothetical protein